MPEISYTNAVRRGFNQANRISDPINFPFQTGGGDNPLAGFSFFQPQAPGFSIPGTEGEYPYNTYPGDPAGGIRPPAPLEPSPDPTGPDQADPVPFPRPYTPDRPLALQQDPPGTITDTTPIMDTITDKFDPTNTLGINDLSDIIGGDPTRPDYGFPGTQTELLVGNVGRGIGTSARPGSGILDEGGLLNPTGFSLTESLFVGAFKGGLSGFLGPFNALNPFSGASLTSRLPGLTQIARVVDQGASISDVADYLLDADRVIGDVVEGAATGAAIQVADDWINSKLDDAGFIGPASELGETIGQGLALTAAVLGEGFPGIGTVAGAAGRVVGDVVGDVFDVREDEPVRDFFEDDSGWLGGHRDYADYVAYEDFSTGDQVNSNFFTLEDTGYQSAFPDVATPEGAGLGLAPEVELSFDALIDQAATQPTYDWADLGDEYIPQGDYNQNNLAPGQEEAYDEDLIEDVDTSYDNLIHDQDVGPTTDR